MAPVDTSLYDALGVEATATPSDLKKAYRVKALKLHPDKGGDEEQFKAMKYAYDILSDPQRRETYDKYGLQVLKMQEGNVGNPADLLKAMAAVGNRERMLAALVLVSFAAAILSPLILVSLRWDGHIGIHWLAVFIPLWILETIGLVLLLRCIEAPPPADQEADWDAEARNMYEERKAQVCMLKCYGATWVGLMMVAQLFVALKLEGTLHWSWFLVLLPVVLLELLQLTWAYFGAPEAFAQSDPEAAAAAVATGQFKRSPQFLLFLVKALGWGVVRLITLSLVAARADGLFSGSWMMCCLPAILASAVVILYACTKAGKKRRTPEADPESGSAAAPPASQEEAEEEGSPAIGACCSVGFWLVMVLGAAGKMDGGSYSAFLIFLPIFIIVGCITCCFTCLVAQVTPEHVETMAQQQQAEQREREGLNRATQGAEQPSYGSAGARPEEEDRRPQTE
eukprot:TRINITY_DN102811_c0_g1_i1.p1 TRINITY_DN102811_c0_g1~~TRINITY_DN102811_c0_g1_i1.p1  ORF type:complete len:454 (+),score=114.80 TRINITY_DN102811_c0_g1_i1:101-1462(+)